MARFGPQMCQKTRIVTRMTERLSDNRFRVMMSGVSCFIILDLSEVKGPFQGDSFTLAKIQE